MAVEFELWRTKPPTSSQSQFITMLFIRIQVRIRGRCLMVGISQYQDQGPEWGREARRELCWHWNLVRYETGEDRNLWAVQQLQQAEMGSSIPHISININQAELLSRTSDRCIITSDNESES